MPKLNMDTIQLSGVGNFQFSAVRPEDLGATEYTLVSLVLDVSGSVDSWKDELLKTEKAIVGACKKSPRSDNLLLRIVHFGSNINEIHGFKPLSEINEDDYKNIKIDGLTALFNATDTSIQATIQYAKDLTENDYICNACIYVVTDGDNNISGRTAADIKKRITQAIKSECLESIIVVLVGITGGNHMLLQYLEDFQKDADITQFVDIGDATPQRLAKLAGFVSKSISSQSQSLGTGSASQPFAF